MKKMYLLGSLFLFGILMSSSLVSAGWFDSLFNRDSNLVGQAYVYTIAVKEQVKCVFKDSTATQVCSSNKGSCKGVGSCVVTVRGKKGEQVTWKSSCGGYAYTTMDGQNDVAEFKCSSVIPPQTFYKAFWECYDGYYIQASGKKPLTSETWKKYAEEDCKGHCYEDNSKCGVNSFGVLQ